MLVESEYRRHGTLAYLAAYDVHHAHVIGHCAPTTGIQPFTALAETVMTREPYASARRVFWILRRASPFRTADPLGSILERRGINVSETSEVFAGVS